MPRLGRPPVTEEALRERIAAYCSRYGVKVNDEGFPAFPSGFRETPRHREWMSLYKAFQRVRARSRPAASEGARRCPVCLQDSSGPGRTHRRCAAVVGFLRQLGPSGFDRLRTQAFPDDPGPAVGNVQARSGRKA